MKHLLFLFLPITIGVSLFFLAANGQNLVPNPSFEGYLTCPDASGQISRATGWYNPTTASPDYYNSCFDAGANNVGVPNNFLGYQEPIDGEAYAGMILFENAGTAVYREYLQTRLTETLEVNELYYFSAWASLADSSVYTMREFSVYFSEDSLLASNFSNLEVNPQINFLSITYFDDSEWIEITGEFLATGTEQFITLGYFRDNLDIDTVATGNSENHIHYDFAYLYLDHICLSNVLSDCNLPNGLNEQRSRGLKVFPNPADERITIQTEGNLPFDVIIYSADGKVEFTSVAHPSKSINVSQLPSGRYWVRVTTNDFSRIYPLIINPQLAQVF